MPNPMLTWNEFKMTTKCFEPSLTHIGEVCSYYTERFLWKCPKISADMSYCFSAYHQMDYNGGYMRPVSTWSLCFIWPDYWQRTQVTGKCRPKVAISVYKYERNSHLFIQISEGTTHAVTWNLIWPQNWQIKLTVWGSAVKWWRLYIPSTSLLPPIT